MLIASDIHLHNWSAFSHTNAKGENSRLRIILDELERAAKMACDSGHETMYVTGDLFHVRGSVAPSVINPTLDMFRKIQDEYELEVRIIPGNHDLESRNSAALTNASQALDGIGCTIANEPTLFEDDQVLMLPWYDSIKELKAVIADQIDKLGDVSGITLMIHAPLNSVIIGIPDHGLDPAECASWGFKRVFCGHYHNHVSFTSEIYSVGATTHQTWSDVGSKAGFILVEDDEVHHIESEAPRFMDYDTTWSVDHAKEVIPNNYVRVKLHGVMDSDVTLLRNQFAQEYDAAGVVFNVLPKSKATPRRGKPTKVSSIQQSIGDWLKATKTIEKANRKDVQSACERIVSDIGGPS